MGANSVREIGLTIFQGRAGDHNDLAIPGAASLGSALAQRLSLAITTVGRPEPALGVDWQRELDAARPTLRALAARCDAILQQAMVPLTALTRCAAALATLPVVARHRPDALIVWLDAHGDLNTPDTTTTGFLGGLPLAGAAGLWQSGLGGDLDLANLILVGARDLDPAELILIRDRKIPLIPPHPALATAVAKAIAGRPVYIHLDCDVLAPGIVPTDYSVEGGLSLADLRDVLSVAAASEVIGMEIAEFQNVWEPGGDPASPAGLIDALEPILAEWVQIS
jgi:arginase